MKNGACYWHRFAPESRLMRRVTDALIAHGHRVLRQDDVAGINFDDQVDVVFEIKPNTP
jgi:hypothetical protein